MIYDLPELWIDEAQENDLSDADFYEELQLDADGLFDDREDAPDAYNLEGEFDIDSFDW